MGQAFSILSKISAALAGLPYDSSKCAQCRCSSCLSKWWTVQARSNTSRSTAINSGLVSIRSSRNFINCKHIISFIGLYFYILIWINLFWLHGLPSGLSGSHIRQHCLIHKLVPRLGVDCICFTNFSLLTKSVSFMFVKKT